MKIAYLECFSGISGDMFLGALVDAGVPLATMQTAVDALGIGVHLEARKVNRSGITATKIDVLTAAGELAEKATHKENRSSSGHAHTHVDEHGHAYTHTHSHSHEGHSHEHPHEPHGHGRSLSRIRAMIQNAQIDPQVQRLAVNAFELLGQAEARIHNVPVEEIHFHEVGAIDAIADIVGVAAGCVSLGVDRWYCSALNVGSGSVECAHGTFPVPAPATLNLLAGVPIYSRGPSVELVTPTGAALLKSLGVEFGEVPGMVPRDVGYGAGTKDFSGFPNVARLTVGESTSSDLLGRDDRLPRQSTGVIETTIDDSNPQVVAYVADLLLEQGATEVFRTPVQMKKGRSGVLMTVLCAPADAPKLRQILLRETSTIGLRYREEQKFVLAREFVSASTEWGPVRIKVARLPNGEVTNAAPEFEDCRRIARASGVPLKRVLFEASKAFAGQGSGQDRPEEVAIEAFSDTRP